MRESARGHGRAPSPVALSALLLVSFAIGAPARAAKVRIVDAGGARVPGATALCLDPASAQPITAREGAADLPSSCRRARCDATGYLAAEVAIPAEGASCTLRKGLVVTGDLPAAAVGAGVAVRLEPGAGGKPVAARDLAKPVGGAVARFALPAVPPGRYVLEVVRGADGWRCRADLGPLGAARYAVNPDWHDPMTLAVRVVDAKDKPAVKVPVRTFHGAPPSDGPPGGGKTGIGDWSCAAVAPAPVDTDAHGVARVRVTSGEGALVVAGDWKEPRGLAVEAIDRPPAKPLTLQLARPARLHAKLLDEGDRPVGCRATYGIVAADARWAAAELPGGGTDGTCTAEGVLTIGPFLPRGGTLEVTPKKGLPLRLTVDPPAPGATVDLGVVRVKTGESIRVAVQDAAGHPIPGADVLARGSAGIITSAEGTTDPDGGLALAGFPKAATMTLHVKADGFVDVWKRALPIEESPFTVVLKRGAVIDGHVRDRDGAPIAEAKVEASSPDLPDPAPATSDAEGAFSLPALSDGPYDVTATATGYAGARPVRVEVHDRRADRSVDLVLDPAPPLRGRVVDPTGSPVAGARVMLVPRRYAELLGRAPIAAEAVSGADGGFEIASEVDPEQWLVALHPGFAPGVERSPANAAKLGKVTVVLGEAAALRVHAAAGETTPPRILVVDGAGLGHAATETGSGETDFADLAAGAARVTSSRTTPKDVTLVAGQTADVTLDDAPWIEGTVTADGLPAPRVYVHAGREDVDRPEGGGGGFTDQHGAYRLDGLGEGLWRVVAVGEDGRAETTVTLPASGPTRLDLDLRMARLDVTVERADTGAPVANLWIAVKPAGATCSRMTATKSWEASDDLGFDLQVGSGGCLSGRTDSAGLARVVLAGPGTYGLSIHDPAYEPYDAPVGVPEGITTKRVLVTPKAAKGKGTVHVRLTTDPPGLAGTLTCIEGGSTWVTSPLRNRQDCGDLRPGPADVVFHVDGYGAGHATVAVPDGGEVTVDLVVARGGKLVVPVSEPGKPPEVVDGSGFVWARPNGHGVIQGVAADLPDVGKAWVFDDLPAGTYTVTVGGASRNPVPLASGGVATAN